MADDIEAITDLYFAIKAHQEALLLDCFLSGKNRACMNEKDSNLAELQVMENKIKISKLNQQSAYAIARIEEILEDRFK